MTNPYAPPRDASAQDEQPIARSQRSAQFYYVSIATLVAWQLVTFGLYAVYWFYRHWAVQKRARRLNISPLARGIFAIFFVHRLFKAIDDGARATGLVPAWNHRAQATVLVLLMLFGRVTERFSSDFTTFGIIGIASLVASLVPLTAAQRVANRANGQSFLDQGDSDVEHEDEGEEEE